MEKGIQPEHYTPEILRCVERIKDRMDFTNTIFNDSDIKVFELDTGDIYILANPQLGYESIFDDFGNFIEMVPLYNLTELRDENWFDSKRIEDEWIVNVKMPRIKIMRPDLCIRITKDGALIEHP